MSCIYYNHLSNCHSELIHSNVNNHITLDGGMHTNGYSVSGLFPSSLWYGIAQQQHCSHSQSTHVCSVWVDHAVCYNFNIFLKYGIIELSMCGSGSEYFSITCAYMYIWSIRKNNKSFKFLAEFYWNSVISQKVAAYPS